ncbi:Serine-threonine/tyrosine-protein kinase [Theobroma cacao]|nr:Serine-threonine/tyrosine-protein kinase [Theobroma cacao]
MGLGLEEGKVKSWDMCKSKGRKKKKNSEKEDLDDEAVVEETGCWVKLRLIGSCISARSKVDSSVSGTSTHYDSKSANDTSRDQPTAPVVSSTTTSNAESNASTSKLEEELKVASRLRKFAFNDLKLATRNFRPESLLGEGGFGCVFKGWIEENGTAPVKPGTGLTVAVKTLNHDGLQGHKEWLAEVNFLGDLVHPNLVKLIGYCIEDDQRLLVYEFMPRGSLENHLFRRHLTSRSDVYSFGVVLLEMLTGRRSMDKNRPNGEHNLVEWARPHLGERRRFYRLIDPRLEGHFSIKGAQKAAQLAAHCLSRDPKARPLMSEVVEALKPLPNLKDMASSSYYFQTMQAERIGSSPNARNDVFCQSICSQTMEKATVKTCLPHVVFRMIASPAG